MPANMKNIESHKIRDADEARKKGKKGGIASGRKRREQKKFRDIMTTLLAMPMSSVQGKLAMTIRAYGLDPEAMTQKEVLAFTLMRRAQQGKDKAVEMVLGAIGELPVVRTQTELDGELKIQIDYGDG